MPKAYGYLRVSTDDQDEEAQRLIVRGYFDGVLAPHGFAWGGFHQDHGVSGSVPFLSRKGGLALSLAADAGDAVVVAKLDRAFRDTRDCLHTVHVWKARGVALHLLDLRLDTSSDVGELMLTMMAGVATFERRRLSARVRECFAARRLRGMASGGNPGYGFRFAGPAGAKRPVPDPAQREVGARIVEWKGKGFSWEQIALHLLHSRVKNPRTDGEFSIAAVRAWFRLERNLRALEQRRAGGGGNGPGPAVKSESV